MPSLFKLTLSLSICLISFAFAQLELESKRIKVIFPNETLEPFAQEIARDAERALDVLEPIFGLPEIKIVLKLEDLSDAYNAFAIQLPRPNVRLRALFPLEGGLGFGASSDLYLLIIHELTHITQLGFTQTVDGGAGLSLGLVGENVASLPPPWFIEGIATYIESIATEGGRLNDATSKGILQARAAADLWPELTDLNLTTYSDWPGGAARYLYGAGFIDYLVRSYSFEAILNTLREYNSGLIPKSFSQAWQAANDSLLADEWQTWQKELLSQIEARAYNEDVLLSESGFYTGSATLSPNGKQLAWVSRGSSINLASFQDNELRGEASLIKDVAARSLSWLNDNTIIYSRTFRQPDVSYSELFSLNITTKEETKLTSGARASFPNVTPEGCILYVKDSVINGSSLIEWCDATERLVFQTDASTHIVGLSVSKEGQIALSVWRAGFVDIALLQNNALNFLMTDRYQDIDPTWQGEDKLLFSSYRTGVFNLYQLELSSQNLTQLSDVLAGAYEPLSVGDTILYQSLGSEGFDLAYLEDALAISAPLETAALSVADVKTAPLEVQQYNPLPSLLQPYGWYPSGFSAGLSPLGAGASVSLVAQDDSGEHSYAAIAGYDTRLIGHLYGATANLSYGYRDNVDPARIQNYPFGVQVQTGVWQHYPHLQGSTESAFGVRSQLRFTQPFDKWSLYSVSRLGLIHLNSKDAWHLEGLAGLTFSQRRSDDWGYVRSGSRVSLTGIWTPTPTGVSAGAWANASYYAPLSQFGLDAPGTTEFALRAGYRQAPPIPLGLNNYAAVATLGYRYSLPVNLRYDDGFLALERVTLEPRLRSWFDGSAGVGADLTLSLDTVALYNGPVAIGLSVGYGQDFWYKVGLSFAGN